jgi:DNA polymerase-3 subunit gamma/tau
VDGDPCNACASCRGIESGAILDVLELDAASNNGVDNVRALREEAIYTPASVKRRVYIVDEVHMLSTQAFNALLKILEEPPEHLVFILATTELHKVPATILSRCQRFSFKRISQAAISARLYAVAENEGLTLTADAAAKLASLADGSMRDALSLLDQCASDTVVDLPRVLDMLGLAGHNATLRLADSMADRDAMAVLEILEGLYDDGRDMASLLNELAQVVRDILVYKLSPGAGLISGMLDSAELSALSAKLPPERLFFYLDLIREAVAGLQRGGIAKLPVEICLVRMCDERLTGNVPAMLSRIARLEEQPRPVMTITDDSAKNKEATLNSQIPSPAIALAPAPEDDWARILEMLKTDGATYSLLCDGAKVKAAIRDNALIISAGDKFTADSIEKPSASQSLKEAALKALGRDVLIRVERCGGSSVDNGASKIESLRAYDVVKFE